MIRRSLAPVPCLLFCLLAPPCLADNEYWVMLSSHRDSSEAESVRTEASSVLPESFSIVEESLDDGLWFRVQVGPYLTPEIAEHLLDEAHRQGYESARILVRETSLVGTSLDDPVELTSPGATSAELSGSEPRDVPGYNAPVRTESEREHKLVDEAPPGYELNRLRRNRPSEG